MTEKNKKFWDFFSIGFKKVTIFRKCVQNYPEHYQPKQKKSHDSDLAIVSYFLKKTTLNKSMFVKRFASFYFTFEECR